MLKSHSKYVRKLFTNMSRLRYFVLALMFLVAAASLMTGNFVPVFASVIYGDTNIEPVAITLVSQYVEALTRITVTHPTVIQSVSLYLQYTDSDGSQCIKFGIYKDNSNGNPLNQSLVAATQNGYCLQMTTSWGPAWETWNLTQSDFMTINTPGTYWLCTLAEEAYGTIYHYTYTGAYGGYYLYNYGYYGGYAFPASYTLGFPPTVFGNTTYGNFLIVPYNSNNIGQYNAPYSFYATGT